MKNICLFVLGLALLSCTESDKSIEKEYSFNNIIDTVSSMNAFFNIEEIPIKAKSLTIGDIKDYTLDDAHNIYILDKNSIIYKFEKNGNYISKLDNIGRGPGEHLMIMKFVVDEYQNIFVDDFLQGQIQMYDKNFIHQKYIKTNSPKAISDIQVYNNRIYCFDPFSEEYSITIYDIESGEEIDQLGQIDELVKKYNTRVKSGSLIIEDQIIYYGLPNYYQIYKITDNNISECLFETPSHFNQITKRIKNPMVDTWKYSYLSKIYKEKDVFLITTFQNNNQRQKKENYYQPTDIISFNGSIIKESIYFYNIEKPLKKTRDGTYVSYKYSEGINNKINIVFLKLTYKY